MKTVVQALVISMAVGLLVLPSCDGTSKGDSSGSEGHTALYQMPSQQPGPHKGNPQRTGVYTSTGTPTLDGILWKSADYDILWQPVVAEGMVFFVALSNDLPHDLSDYLSFTGDDLYALDAKTGQAQWNILNVSDTTQPTVADGTLLYFKRAGLHAADVKTGKEKWVFNTNDDRVSDPTVFGGIVYFSTSDSYFHAVDLSSGKEKWSVLIENSDPGFLVMSLTTEPLIVGDTLIFGTRSGYVHALDLGTGVHRWQTRVGDALAQDLALGDGLLYIDAGTDVTPTKPPGPYRGMDPPPRFYDDKLYALDLQTGQQIWQYASPSGVSDPVVYDGLVYGIIPYEESTKSGNIYAIDAKTGKQVWRTTAKAELRPDSLAVSDHLVYAVVRAPYMSNEGDRLYVFDAKTGKERWDFYVSSSLSEPFIADGMLYTIGTFEHKGTLYALDPVTGRQLKQISSASGMGTAVIANGVVYVLTGDFSTLNLTAIR